MKNWQKMRLKSKITSAMIIDGINIDYERSNENLNERLIMKD